MDISYFQILIYHYNINLSKNYLAHAAIRRYKTLCERFRRETVKQQSIPNYTSNWNLFEKFASLKDFQMCGNKIKIKSEVGDINDSINVNNTQLVNSSLLYGGGGGGGSGIGVFAEMDFMNDNNDTINSDGFENPFDGGPIDGRGSGLCVEPTCIGGSTDLSTDTIAAFCQFLEANLKQLPEDQSDELIEDISNLLFRKKKQFKNDLNGEST